jgi:hypothetical protein
MSQRRSEGTVSGTVIWCTCCGQVVGAHPGRPKAASSHDVEYLPVASARVGRGASVIVSTTRVT